MNQFRAWLYGYDPGTRLRSNGINESEASGPVEWSEDDKRNTTGEPGVTEHSLKHAILRVIPLAPGDCLECKLVGSGVMLLSGIIVITSAITASTR
ncbi:hypothetical protein ElyMa_004463000 [Elysia marginata]|uniref:Uncharacterized protein n=1 Tax=Elysia marginata TaxID=1093978 RepID=A0AAV4HF84_9GAST|nr:hypothetical protein ElyMa_004463000 [Elysia marginata]